MNPDDGLALGRISVTIIFVLCNVDLTYLDQERERVLKPDPGTFYIEPARVSVVYIDVQPSCVVYIHDIDFIFGLEQCFRFTKLE